MINILKAISESLASINNPRFYETERGFQGELGAELRKRLSDFEIDGAIVEQEYQKRMRDHGIRIRPDIIIHIPFEGSGLADRTEGNFVVIELKHQASKEEAIADFQKLSDMCEALNYPLGVFINIASSKTYFDKYNGKLKERLHSFAVQIVDGVVTQINN